MRLRRRLPFLLAVLLGLAAAWGFIRWLTLPDWLARELAEQLPFPFQVSGIDGVRPLSVQFRALRVGHPMGEGRPDLLTVRRLTLTVPWWGLWIRPVPVEIEMEAPVLVMDVEYGDSLLRQVHFLPMGEAWQDPEAQKAARPFQGMGLLSVRLAPMGLKISEGRMEVVDPDVYADRPLYTVGHFNLSLGMGSPWQYPSILLKAKGDFLTPENKPVGTLTMEAGTGVRLQRMDGRLEIWYDHLEDFRTIYGDAPQPFTFEGGAGGPIIEWAFQGDRLRVSIRCLARGLRIGGSVGEVSWQKILDALADPKGKIDLTVRTEGSLKDPAFDPHDQLLSELDWAMKERAAAKGVRVPGRIFYGLVRPEELDPAHGEPVEP